MQLYFAYGSNMWKAQMARRCPQSPEAGRASLQGYRWIITTRGYASVVQSDGDVVEGVLYALTKQDEIALDECEGVAKGNYFKAWLPVKLAASGSTVDALVYIDHVTDEGPPRPEYILRIEKGLKDARLPPAYAAFVRENLRR